MHNIYGIVTGPLAWIAFILFFGGMIFRLIQLLVRVNQTEKFILSYISLRYSLRSILHWIIPFAAHNWRRHPLLTIVTFIFHICLLITPILLLAHVVVWEEAWGLNWWTLPDILSDVMTLIVIVCCLFFFIRRVILPEVQFITGPSDYILLALVVLPFITGFLSYHQWVEAQWMTLLHIVTGEVMLAAIPFTRLSHMIFAIFTRAYMGSEFGGVRHAHDW